MRQIEEKSALGRFVESLTDAFAFPLKTSHYIELVNPLWTSHSMQARIEKVWDETATARTLTLRPGMNWRSFKPGQHLRVGIPIGGRHFTRTYSISSAPERSDGCFTITVKGIPGGFVSNHIIRKLKVGDYIPIGVPQGDFYIPDAQPVKPLFITAGSGITPIMSMLRSLDAEERFPDTVHIHYAPHNYDVIFGEELGNLGKKYSRYNLTRIFTRDPGGEVTEEGLRNQHFTQTQLEKICPDWRTRDVYACGPQPLLDALESFWETNGLRRQLHTERFRAAIAGSNVPGTAGKLAFSKSNVVFESDGQINILRLAEDNGLNPDHGCRMGICHGCNVKLVEGCVRDLRTNELIQEQGQTIQICVCASVGDAVIDA
jgi:stearoyl-CoA 9-desaturase NADPH oxidoreductase